MELSGIIQNFLEKTKDTNDYSFYKITRYGDKIFSDLMKSYNSYYKKVLPVEKALTKTTIATSTPESIEEQKVVLKDYGEDRELIKKFMEKYGEEWRKLGEDF